MYSNYPEGVNDHDIDMLWSDYWEQEEEKKEREYNKADIEYDISVGA